jgi:hypothetical protein
VIASVVLNGTALNDLQPVPGGSDEGILLGLQDQARLLLAHHAVLVGTVEEWSRLKGLSKKRVCGSVE